MQKIRHAMLFRISDQAYLIYLKDDQQSFGYQRVDREPRTLTGLLELAVAAPFDRYWIHKSYELEPTKEWAEWDAAAWDLRAAWDANDTHMQSIHGWKLPGGGQKAIDIIFPALTRWAKDRGAPAWGATASPKQFLMIISYLEQALGIDIKGSPSSTGWHLAKSLHHKQITDTPEKKLSDMHFNVRAAFDFVDNRMPTPGELGRKILMKLDKGGAYISASHREFYGTGTPVLSRIYDENAVGVWKVRILSLADVPFPIVRKLYDQDHEERWLAAPIVRLMRAMGYELQIIEGNIFLEKYMLLKAWSQRLWDARISFRDDARRWPYENSRRLAEAACKMIAVSTIGITGYRGFKKDEESDKERPDIKLQTIARNYEIVYHNMLKLWKEDGLLPVLVNMDCFYILVDDIDACKVAPSIMLDKNGQSRELALGGYKREGYMPVTPEVQRILTSGEGTHQKKRALDKIGWQK